MRFIFQHNLPCGPHTSSISVAIIKKSSKANMTLSKDHFSHPYTHTHTHKYIYIYICVCVCVCVGGWVFTNGLGDRGSILGRVIPKIQKMVHDYALLDTQHYKVKIKGKVEQSGEWEYRPPLHLGVVVNKKGPFGSPTTKVVNFTF